MINGKRLEREKRTVEIMLKIYCRKKHKVSQDVFCDECKALRTFAFQRLDQCKFGENKPTCGKCPIHCYKPDQRQKMIKVMKFTGPRMFFLHPLTALSHLIDGLKNPKRFN